MSFPIIGITTRGRNTRRRFAVGVSYVEAVRRAGGIPVLIPPEEERLHELLESLDGLVLTGGGDIDPARYGESTHESVYEVNAARDGSEIALVQAALRRQTPLFGICRGAQVINVTLGGSLIIHLPEPELEDQAAVRHRNGNKSARHAVTAAPDSRLASLMGACDVIPVSHHHQAVRDVASTLEVVAHAPDGVIEALEMPGHPFLIAVQWHPELSAAKDPTQQRLFDRFVEAAAVYAAHDRRPDWRLALENAV